MANNKKFLGRGLRLPLRPGPDGGFQKDIETDRIISSSIVVILMTRIGERVWNPEFGSTLSALKHEPNNDITYNRVQRSVFEALERWEPRIKNLQVNVFPAPSFDSVGKFLLEITISYRVISTNRVGNFVWPFYLQR